MKYGFIIDNRKCIGCHACTVACKSENDTPIGVNRTWVKYIEKGAFPNTRRHFSVMRCNHCDDAPCIEICPVTALYKRDDGIVDFDNRRCIGCKACTQACPYDALYIDPESHTAAKCNYCAHRVDRGLRPACVNICPVEAIISGDMDDPESEISILLSREQVTVRKPEKGTKPKLFYIDGDATSLEPTATKQSDNYVSSAQISGVGHFTRYAENRKSGGGQPESGVAENHTIPQSGGEDFKRKAADVVEENKRRVYDAPSKGVVWGWEVSSYLLTKAIASGAFLVPAILSVAGLNIPGSVFQFAVYISLVFLGITGALLVKDLDKPSRFLYVILRPQWGSWLVRGAYIISGYSLVLTLWIVANVRGLSELQEVLQIIGIPFAFMTAVYTAFLFAQAKGRDFWQSPMMPFHMLVQAVIAGSAALCIMTLFVEIGASWIGTVRWVLFGTILFHVTIGIFELTVPHSTDDAAETVRSIVKGQFKNLFWYGLAFAGNAVPLLILFFGGESGIALAGLIALVGVYIAEHLLVKAPQMIPLS